MKVENFPRDLTWDMVWDECQKQTIEIVASMIADQIALLESKNCHEDHVAEHELCVLFKNIQNKFSRRKNEKEIIS